MTEQSRARVGTRAELRQIAFEELVAAELDGAYRTAAVILGDQSEAEDAVQEAMVRAWERLDQLRESDRAGAWFGRILVNLCRDRLRARSRSRVPWLSGTAVTAVTAAPDFAERDALGRALASLNPDQRIVLVLRFYLDLSLEAIAARTGAPLGTVKTRLHHGLRAVRAAYEAQDRRGGGAR